MNIDVAFTPAEVQALPQKVCIVVDVIRSTSTLAVLMSRKPGKVVLTPTVQKAMKYASQQSAHPLLCGERGGLPPEGFDHGNSPREYKDLNVTGRTIVFTSSNGTRAVADVNMASYVLLGSFLNGSAVVDYALGLARKDHLDLLVVCAGREEKFALDDAYCAGFLVSKMLGSIGANERFDLGDGGQAALGMYGYYRDPKKLFEMSGSGKAIMEVGLGADIEFLLNIDAYPTVPHLITSGKKPEHSEWGFSTFLTESF